MPQTAFQVSDAQLCRTLDSSDFASLRYVKQAPPPPYLQPGKCLYTTVRELVENSLDSTEDISQLPDIEVTMCGAALLSLKP